MSTKLLPAKTSFTSAFKKTVARYESLNAGKKADYTRSTNKTVQSTGQKKADK